MPWQDETRYALDKPRGEPRIWVWQTKDIRVRVHRHIHYPSDVWLLSCRQIAVDNHELEERDVEAAQAEALRFVHETATRYALLTNIIVPGPT